MYGELQAELLRGLLEAHGIQVVFFWEGAGRAYGINVGPLGLVQIMVPAHTAPEARKILEEYYAGKFEDSGGTDGEERESEED